MRAIQCLISRAIGNASRGRRPSVVMPLGIFQLRGFSKRPTNRRYGKQEEQRHSRDSSPDREQSLEPSTTHHVGIERPQRTRTPLASVPELDPEIHKNLARMSKILKEHQELESKMRKKLSDCGHTAKELETLRRTGRYSFEITLQKIEQSSLVKGPWKDEELRILKKMREDRKHTRIIAHHLARNEESVKAQIERLSDYFQECNRPPLYKGPQALSPELESSIFRSRLETVWEGLMTLPISREWAKVLSKSQPESWLSRIEEHTPKHVKSILASHQPPSIARLESVEWSTTTAAGVYGWVLKPKGLLSPFDNECYLWVGSASKYGSGLKGRKENLLSSSRATQHEVPKPDVKDLRLSRKGKFTTLLEVPFEGGSAEEVRRIETLVKLAREVFVIWLAAAKDCRAIKEIVPWEKEDIRYCGLASHNLVRNMRSGRGENVGRK